MESQSQKTEENKPMSRKTILSIILIIIISLVVIVLIAKYTFNIDLVNFEDIAKRVGTLRMIKIGGG